MHEVPTWIPDWTDQSKYPSHHLLSYWAWEFLRRNAGYQNDYKAFSSLPDAIDNNTTGKWKGSLREPLHCFYCNPAAMPGETVEEYLIRNAHEDWQAIPMADYLCSKWGISPVPHDPSNDNPFALGPGFEEYRPPIVDYSDEGLVPTESGEIAVLFNLAWPIEDQLEAAKEALLERRKTWEQLAGFKRRRQARERSSSYKTYLRLLDAELTGASVSDMADVLFPHIRNIYPDFSANDRVKKSLQAARRMRDSGYRALWGK
ncbi:MAG: DNA -binding domain-containing protein [Pseudomonadota bacterium]